MRKTEIYTYDRKELINNTSTISTNTINEFKYITEKNIANIFFPNSKIYAGNVSYINNLVLSDNISFNTSTGTIITHDGSLVFNFNYTLKFNNSSPDDNLILIANPTFMSGKYLNYKNIVVSVQVLDTNGVRVIVIEYYE